MAYRAAIILSRNRHCSIYGRKNIASSFLSETLPLVSEQRKYHNGQNGSDSRHDEYNGKWSEGIKFGIGFGITTTAIISGLSATALLDEETKDTKLANKLSCHTILAEENQDKKVSDKEANFRRTQTLDKIFDYFATYRYINKKGKNVNLMSIKDFYNAITPGSSITHGTGLISEADYSKVTDSDIHSDKLYQTEEIPVPLSILNKVRKTGCFNLTNI